MRPATDTITDAMVEAACRAALGDIWTPEEDGSDPMNAMFYRRERKAARRMLEAAAAAAPPSPEGMDAATEAIERAAASPAFLAELAEYRRELCGPTEVMRAALAAAAEVAKALPATEDVPEGPQG